MKKINLSILCVIIFSAVTVFLNSPFPKTSNLLSKLFFSGSQNAKSNLNIPAATSSGTYFPVGPGSVDVIPHQIVRTNADRLYLFAYNPSSTVLSVYRTIGTGLPQSASDFAAPVKITETSSPIGVDAAYDGGNIIHMLINTKDSHIKDYPFNVITNTFNAPTIIASDGGTVTGDYIGTSGAAAMVDLNGNLHVAYWTNGNHIVHRTYIYNSSTNTLTPVSNFIQVDTAGRANHPSVAISPVDNSLTVAWVSEADAPPRIRTRTRASNGTWGSIQSASTASVWTSTSYGINIDQGPSLIIDSTGVKHLTYIQSAAVGVDYGRIHYVADTGSGWVDHPLNAFSHDPALAINSGGEMYIIGHGHPDSPSCLSMDDMCIIKRNSDGTWGNPQLFAAHPGSGQPLDSFDGSPSVKWSVVGFNRPETIEFIFFKTPYGAPTMYYGRLQPSTFAVISGNAGAAGVTLSYVDGTAKATTSQSNGNYSLQVSSGWSGTVTPSHACYTFTPVNRSYSNLTTQQVGQDFAATYNSAADCANFGVTIGSDLMGNDAVASNSSLTKSYASVLDGPVKIVSTSGNNIFASQRAVYGNSFNELMGYPADQFGKEYWFPWYDNVYMKTWVLVGNPSATDTAYVDIYIGGVKVNNTIGGIPYKILPGENIQPRFPGQPSGPVRVVSVTGAGTPSPLNIFASERSTFHSSFNEVMGVPFDQFTTEYWFPWYDNTYMKTWVLVGNPSATDTAYVDIYIGGVKVNDTEGGVPYAIPANSNIQPRFPGQPSGPVRVVSVTGDGTPTPLNIFSSERSTYGASFSEVMGMPSRPVHDRLLVHLGGQVQYQ